MARALGAVMRFRPAQAGGGAQNLAGGPGVLQIGQQGAGVWLRGRGLAPPLALGGRRVLCVAGHALAGGILGLALRTGGRGLGHAAQAVAELGLAGAVLVDVGRRRTRSGRCGQLAELGVIL